MKGSYRLALAAALLALGAGTANAQNTYITECIARAVTQAQSAGSYSNYGFASSSFCMLGGWITQGRELQYSMTMEEGNSYLFVGAGDSDVRDLDLSVSDGSNTVEDVETDNTPFVHIECEGTVEVTITLKNYTGSGQPDFCCMIILEESGGQGSVTALNAAAQGLMQNVNAIGGNWSSDTAADASCWCLVGGLFGTGGELGISRSFSSGNYALVGFGDSRAQDLDAFVNDEDGNEVAADTETDATPVVQFNVSSNCRGTLNLRMYASRGNAFGVAIILKQR